MEQDASAAAAAARDRTPVPAVHGPAGRTGPRLFIAHAPEDAWFVDGFLVGALSLPEDDVLLSSKLEPGAVLVEEIARGALCPIIVVVLSPAFLTSPWAQFAHQLALQQTIESANDGKVTLIPALLMDCELPLLARSRAPLDFRSLRREHWEAEAATLRARLDAPAPAAATVPCPYPGIRPFTTDDAEHFHGRNQEVADLLGRLRDGQRELYVIGPSGSGKSSLVAAGLGPRLRSSPGLAGGAFLVRSMRPGADPTAALARALDATAAEQCGAVPWLGDAVGRLLASPPAHDRLLVIVDQLEELFTLAGAGARAAFIAGLRALRGEPRVALVLTLRADFYAALMESALWTDLDGQLSRLDVGPLRGDRLRIAIEAPAAALGVYFEPVLVERLLHDVADEPGALPLLQDVLLELWHQRTHGLLRLAEYEAMSDGPRSGVAVTVARRANGALSDLPPARRAIAQRVLLRLVQFGDGVATTRRQQTRDDLATAADAPDDIDAVVHHLADRRLITTSADSDAGNAVRIDLAHEVLLSAWPVLGEWIRSRRHDEQRRRALEARAAEWVNHGRGQSRLLDGDELQEVRGWLGADAARDLGVSEAIQSLVARSEAALAARAAEDALRRRRWRRWVTIAIVALSGAVIAVSALAVFAMRRSQEARAQARVADEQRRASDEQRRAADEQRRAARQQLARNYAAQGQALLVQGQPAQAVPYLLAAREAGTDDMALRMLFRWAAQGVPLARLSHSAAVKTAVWSPDGTRLATASEDRTARIWSARTGQPITSPIVHGRRVDGVAWSPDGTRVATGSEDGIARVWDAASGQPAIPPLTHAYGVSAVAWSPDGTRLATTSRSSEVPVWDAATGRLLTRLAADGEVAAVAWSPDGTRLVTRTASGGDTAQVWDAASGRPLTPALAGFVRSVAWSPDGARLAIAAGKIARVWDAATGQPTAPPLVGESAIDQVAWSPDGTQLATASTNARVWDAATGRGITPPLVHRRSVHRVAWSPDGTQLATASADATARVWDAASGWPALPPFVHQGEVDDMAWSPDGTRLVTASEDGLARVWDVAGGRRATRVLGHSGRVYAVAWSPDGTRVATASEDATARVWDATRERRITPALAHENSVFMAAWSPDGTKIATASKDGTTRVWDAASGQPVTPPLAHQGAIRAVAWRRDGAQLATASADHTARVWDAASGQPVTPPLAHDAPVTAIVWAPDGTQVATASEDGTARVWSASSGEPAMPPLVHGEVVLAVAWSPDGRRIATAGYDGIARRWNAASGEAAPPPLVHQRKVWSVVWSPDGTRLATAGDDGARVWNADDGQPVTPLFAQAAANAVSAVAWSPDGTRVATASEDSTARVWDAATGWQVAPPLTHDGPIWAVAWSPDGTRLATASSDCTARVWDVAWDPGTLADWRAVVERGDYRLNRAGVVVVREPPRSP